MRTPADGAGAIPGVTPDKAYIDVTEFASLSEAEQVDRVKAMLGMIGSPPAVKQADDVNVSPAKPSTADRRALLEDPRVVEALVGWMWSLGEVAFDEVDELRQVFEEAGLSGELVSIVDGALLLGSSYSAKWLLIPDGDWTWSRGLREERVIAIRSDDDVRHTTIAELRDDPVFWLKTDAHLGGVADVDALPFRFDGDAWAGSVEDDAFGTSDWRIHLDGIEHAVSLIDVDMGFAATEHAKPGTWLSLDCGGLSMSTGEIGFDIWLKTDGALFVFNWGYMCTMVGHAGPEFGVKDLMAPLDPKNIDNVGIGNVASVASKVLDVEQMRELVTWLLNVTDVDDPDEVEVTCLGWSGTAAELLGDESGDTEELDDESGEHRSA